VKTPVSARDYTVSCSLNPPYVGNRNAEVIEHKFNWNAFTNLGGKTETGAMAQQLEAGV